MSCFLRGSASRDPASDTTRQDMRRLRLEDRQRQLMEQLARGPGIWRRGCLSNSQSQLRPWVKQQATRPWVQQQDHVFPGLS